MKKSNYLFALALGVSTLTFAQVGIGTSTPSSPLDIQADDAAIDINNTAADGDPSLNFQLSGTTTFSIGIDDGDSDKLKIGTTAPDASTRMTIVSSGNVGIGTTSPSSLLQVGETDNASNSAITVAGNGTGSQEGGELRLATAADYDGTYDIYRLDVYEDYFRIGRQSKSDFFIKSNGYCGIGSDNTMGSDMSPATPLEVSNYNATTNSVVDIFTLSQVTSGTPAAGIGAGLIFEIQDGGNIEEQGRINVELDDVTNGSEDATMTFDINKNGTITEVMRIDGTQGYVGIGTSSPSTLLQVGETDNGSNSAITIAGSATGIEEGGELRLATAADYDGTYDFYRLDAFGDYFRIGRQSKSDFFIKPNGYCGIGSDNTTGTNMSPVTPLEVSNYNATTNSVVDILTLSQVTSGTPAAGIGVGLIFEIQDAGNIEEQGRINVELDDVTSTAEDATMTFDINRNGTMMEVMRIDGTNGYVGIGTTSPSTLLQVGETDNGSNSTITIAGSATGSTEGGELRLATAADYDGTYDFYVIDAFNDDLRIRRSGQSDLVLTNDGYFGIGTSTPTEKLHVVGNICYTGTSASCSDIRYKKDFNKIDNALDMISKFDGYTYKFKVEEFPENDFDSTQQVGFIAQEIQEVLPQVVLENDSGYLSVDYSKVTPLLLMAIKEQQAIIEAQNKEIAKEKAENEAQKAEIESLKAEASNATSSSEENTQKLAELEAKLNALLQAQTATASVVK